MKCKECKSNSIKHGHKLSGQQVYRCTSCGHCFTSNSKRRLDDEKKSEVVSRLLQGVDINEVAEEFGVSKRTIQRIIKKEREE